MPSRSFVDVWGRIRTSSFWIVTIALLLRVGWILVGHTYKFRSTDNNFGFGWEMGRIGASLASGRGFSDPFGPPTGPTAWEPPLYPYLIAAVFQVFGIYSRGVGVCAARDQQCFLGADLRSNLSDCEADFLGESCGWVGVGLGACCRT